MSFDIVNPRISDFFSLNKEALLKLANQFQVEIKAVKKSEIQSVLYEHVFGVETVEDENDKQRRHEVRLKELEIKEREKEREHELELKRIEIGERRVTSNERDITKLLPLVPEFDENDVFQYFEYFERVAKNFCWSKSIWSNLVQTALKGRARSVLSSFADSEVILYEVLKQRVLTLYHAVPEAYRQKFRGSKKGKTQSFLEFSQEKKESFDRWCRAEEIKTLNQLQELILVEEFKSSVPEKVRVYLNERGEKGDTLTRVATLADEFSLAHSHDQGYYQETNENQIRTDSHTLSPKTNYTRTKIPECTHCRKRGHTIANCFRVQSQKVNGAKANENQNTGVGDPKAAVYNSQTYTTNSSFPRSKDLLCTHCHKRGHTVANCFQLHPHEEA